MSEPIAVTVHKAPPRSMYSSGEIILYGVPLAEVIAGKISVIAMSQPISKYETALIYGFSYQGHCYSMAEPFAMVVPQGRRSLAVGCGYGDASAGQFFMWTVEKLEEAVQIQVSSGTFEELVLRRNLEETRQPLSYRSAERVAHRGRLIE
jgi:hypothetical protein